ncbi:tetratricopeptide repeat protein [Nitrospira sp. Nam80]
MMKRVWRAHFHFVMLLTMYLATCTLTSHAQELSGTETYDFKMSKGILEFSRGRYEKAGELFQQALSARPGDVDALDYLGQTMLRLKNYQGAETVFRESLGHQPQSARAFLGLGMAQTGLRKYQEALTALTAAEQVSADNPLIYYFKGFVTQQLSAYAESQALFSRAMALSPDLTPSVRYYTGVGHYQRGLVEEAQKDFEAAIALSEPDSDLARSAKEILNQQRSVSKRERAWDLSMSASGQYDSNVVLLPLGTQPPGGQTGISQKDDYRTAFYLRGEIRGIQTNAWTVGATYGFYQSFHHTLSAFDVEDHSPSFFVQHQLGPTTTRLQYIYDYVKVGRSPYLIAHAIQPTFTIAEGGNKFTLFQFRYQDKDFQHGRFTANSFRDGKNWLAGVTQYVYFANGAGHVRIGYAYDTDRTGGGSPASAVVGNQTNADWAYRAHRLAAGLSLPPVMTVRLNLAFDYYRQDYDNPSSFSPSGTTRRLDEILFFTGTLSRNVTDNLSIALEYNYTRDQSNVNLFDYARNVYSVTLNAHF